MELIRLDGNNLQKAAKKAADVLKKGGIILYPTDTVYGLGVAAHNLMAIERLRSLKGRERKRPISVIVPDAASIEKYATLTPLAEKFALEHLPGPLTLVVPANATMPGALTLNGAIGMRVPNEPFCLALAKEFGKPYTTTSANMAGLATPNNVEDILQHFRMNIHEIDLVIDGGARLNPNPSTVVSCVGDTPYVLREGMLSRAQLGL